MATCCASQQGSSGLVSGCLVGQWAQSSDSARAAPPPLTVCAQSLSWDSCHHHQWLTSPSPALQHLQPLHCPTKTNFSSTALQRPGCSQNCSSSLSLLLPARISIFASTDSFCALTPNINSFSHLLNSIHSRCSENESLTLRTEGTTMSTLGSRPSSTSLRFFCNEA